MLTAAYGYDPDRMLVRHDAGEYVVLLDLLANEEIFIHRQVKRMVINEKGLLRAMKAAYKAEGYKVARLDRSKELLISAQNWAVTMDWDNVPAGILGLIAEHMRRLPREGEAYQVQAGENPQSEIYGMVASVIDDLSGAERRKVKLTALAYNAMRVWQQEGSLSVMLISPEYESILNAAVKGQCETAAGSIIAEGMVSTAVIHQYDPWASDKPALEYLGKRKWYA